MANAHIPKHGFEFKLSHKLICTFVVIVFGLCCRTSGQSFVIGEILTNPPPLTIEFTRHLEIEPVAFKDPKEAERFAELLKSGKAKLSKGSKSFLFYFNRANKVFWITNSAGESVLLTNKAGVIRSAQGCCEQGCWVEMRHGLMVDTNEFHFDSVVSGKHGGFFWNPYRMASEVLRFGMFELDETTAHFNPETSGWEGKSESGDLVAFSVLPKAIGSEIWIEYSVPKQNIKRRIELHFDRSATLDLGFPSSVHVFNEVNGTMLKYCQYDIKSLKLDKQKNQPECTLATALVSTQPLIFYNGGKSLFKDASGVVTSMEPSSGDVPSKSIKANVILFVIAAMSGLAIFLVSKQKQQTKN